MSTGQAVGGGVGLLAGVAAVLLAYPTGGASLGVFAAAAGLGFSLGSAAGGLLFPVKGPTTEGSRLTDLTVTASTYGVVRPIAYGTVRMAGNVIWGTPIKETKNATHPGGGGGKGSGKGGGATLNTYTYSATFALALCAGPATGVVRMWADGTLLYDQSTGSDVVNTVGLVFRFYPGDDSQLPDSLIEADKGVGNVSGHRGLCYIVFDDLPLLNYGNRIPNIEVQLTFGATADTTPVALTPPAVFGAYTSVGIAINPLTLRGYVYGTSPTGITEFDLLTMAVLGEHPLADIMGDPAYNGITPNPGNGLWIGADQQLYALATNSVLKINPITMAGTAISLGSDDNVGSPFSGNVAVLGGPIAMLGPDGVEAYSMVAGGNMSNLKILDLNGGVFLSMSGGPSSFCPGKVGEMSGESYVLSSGGSTIFLDKVSIGAHQNIGLLGLGTSYYRAASLANVFRLPVAALDSTPGAGIRGVGALVYDTTDDSVIFQVRSSNAHSYLVKWSTAGGQVWTIAVPDGVSGDPDAGQGSAGSDIRDSRFGYIWNRPSGVGGSTIIYIDTAAGAILDTFPWPTFVNGQQVFSSVGDCIVTSATGGTWDKLNIGRLHGQPATLDVIFGDICARVGMAIGDYDVSQLTAISCDGFTVSQRTTGADILKPLAQLFQVDAVECDDKLVFRPRGGAVLATIAEDNLVREAAKAGKAAPEPYLEARVQEIDLPTRFTLSYVDETADFKVVTQQAKRVRTPRPTVFSDQQVDLQAGIVMPSDLAAQRAETLLYAMWLERHSFQLVLPPALMYLDASDPVTCR